MTYRSRLQVARHMRALSRARAALAEPVRGGLWRALSGADGAPAKPAPSAEQEAERAKVIADQFIPERHLEEHGALCWTAETVCGRCWLFLKLRVTMQVCE